MDELLYHKKTVHIDLAIVIAAGPLLQACRGML